MLPEAAAEPLKQYVREGGALVAEARLGWNNERGAASDRIPGMGLWELMGCRETDVQTGARGRTTLAWSASEFPPVTVPARWYEETLEPLAKDARIAARFPSGAAAAVVSTYGKGKTLMLGSYVSAAFESTPTPEAERFYAALLQWAGVDLPIAGAPRTLEVRTLVSGSATIVFAFNHGTKLLDANFALRVPAGAYTAADLVTGDAIPVAREPSVIRLARQLPPAGVWVVRLTRN
jgi:beta-galactosidase